MSETTFGKYWQLFCKNGHLEQPASTEEKPLVCPTCKAKFTCENFVDETDEVTHPRIEPLITGYANVDDGEHAVPIYLIPQQFAFPPKTKEEIKKATLRITCLLKEEKSKLTQVSVNIENHPKMLKAHQDLREAKITTCKIALAIAQRAAENKKDYPEMDDADDLQQSFVEANRLESCCESNIEMTGQELTEAQEPHSTIYGEINRYLYLAENLLRFLDNV